MPPAQRPTLEEIGRRGAYYFARRRTWLRRHVETFEMRSDETGTRRVTIDVVLPTDPESSFPWRDGTRLYYLPIGFIRKHDPVSNINLRAEDDKTLPMPNRIDNARITIEALRGSSLKRLRLSEDDHEVLDSYLESLVFETDPDTQAAWLAHAFGRAVEADPDRFNDGDGKRMRQLWRDVATDSVVWVSIVGAPGQRRVVKFTHGVTLIRPALWPKRPREVEKCYRIEGREEPYTVWDPGDYNSRGFVRRLWHRVATTIGFAALRSLSTSRGFATPRATTSSSTRRRHWR